MNTNTLIDETVINSLKDDIRNIVLNIFKDKTVGLTFNRFAVALSKCDLSSFSKLEFLIGEEECNKFLTSVLVETKLYTSIDGVYAEPIGV